MRKSIGIDVSKTKLDVSIFDGDEHRQISGGNTESGLKELLGRMGRLQGKELVITMEATGTYHLRAAMGLHEAGYTVSVVNPLIIKRYSEMKMLRAKTDPVDARLIAEYGYYERPAEYRPNNKECQELVYLLKTIEGLYRVRGQNRNRIEAFTQSPVCVSVAIESIQRINTAIDDEIKLLERRIRQLIGETYQEEYRRLLGIPGIGKRLGAAIIGYFQEFEHFEKAKQVASYIGVNPAPRNSGSSVRGRGAISRKGNTYLRKLFYMASLAASRHNHECSKLYNRLLSEGKKKKVALIAVSNKLIRQVFAIVKNQREYSPLYQSV